MRKLDSQKTPVRQLSADDWHPADIQAALKKKGWTFRRLALANGYAADSGRRVLDVEWVKMEAIVAEAIGVAPEAIWPSRYSKERNLNFTGGARKLTALNAIRTASARNVKVRGVA
jgi:Ner family transcriptional regulator